MGHVIDLQTAAAAMSPNLSGYPLALFASAEATWRARMINEYASHAVFEALAQQMTEAGFEPELVNECLQFASEERSHGLLCGRWLQRSAAKLGLSCPSQRLTPRIVMRRHVPRCCAT
ncbi:MAG: hypothetical protein RJA70_255 [Pseudomonadota bacterium]